MDTQFPCVPKCTDLVRLSGEIVVFSVRHTILIYERLKIGTIFDPIWRIDIDHLHLACHALFLNQAVHNQQAIPGNQAVAPVVLMLLELDGLAQGRVLLGQGKQRQLRGVVAVSSAYGLDDRARVDALVDMQGYCRQLKGCSLSLARPNELRVEMEIEGITPSAALLVGFRRHKADGRVVHALLVRVCVARYLFLGFLCGCHIESQPSSFDSGQRGLPQNGIAGCVRLNLHKESEEAQQPTTPVNQLTGFPSIDRALVCKV